MIGIFFKQSYQYSHRREVGRAKVWDRQGDSTGHDGLKSQYLSIFNTSQDLWVIFSRARNSQNSISTQLLIWAIVTGTITSVNI